MSTSVGYVLLFFLIALVIVFFIQNTKLESFLSSIEDKTFDLRQSIIVSTKNKKPNQDIVLITIDESSYEYLLGKYGEWPLPRDIYAQLINYLEKQNPRAIAFDLMFIKSMKSKPLADKILAQTVNANDNVYVAMNFDDEHSDIRIPAKLPEQLRVNVKNDTGYDLFSQDLTFSNCRALLPDLMKGKNIGIINISRSDDGILRKMPPFVVYQGNYYPHLSLMIGLKYLNEKEHQNINTKNFVIDKDKNLKIGNRTIPLTEEGGTVLNWYGDAGSFQQVPLYKIMQDIEGKKKLNFSFKDKIIYLGATAVSLYDTKSVPVGKLYPGVELHATYVNNIIDNNFIRKISPELNMAISLILGLIIFFIVMRTSSAFVTVSALIITSVGYIVATYYLMKLANLWVSIVLPITFVLLFFILAYIVKYVLKSRDFEYQYKLATTDGLTELYNHRFFQEQMIAQISQSKRYNTSFSLILIDIDFFKKFNDIYGHQSGDAVLRQVAQKLKKNVRSADFVCRYGGEEMSIILPSTNRDDAIATAEKICKTIAEKPFKLANDKESLVTISLGVSTYPLDGASASEIIEQADKRLYYAKENGRNQVGK